MNNSPDERRQFTRVEFGNSCHLQQDDVHFDTELIDISVNGVLVATPSNYSIKTDQPLLMSTRLSSEAVIEMRVKLAHSSAKLLGFECISIDMDSIAHLRRLVELNIDDNGASERVLAELLHRHG